MAKAAKRPRRSTTVPGSTTGTPPEWAVYVYMKPDAALEAYAERDIQEMVAGATGASVRVLVHLEQERDVRRLKIAEGTITEIPSSAWKDKTYRNRPTDPQSSLNGFLTWAKDYCPGKRRFVVLWGHSRGVGIDFIGPSGLAVDVPDVAAGGNILPAPSGPSPDGLRLPDLIALIPPGRTGVSPSQVKPAPSIDVLGFDSCYMSSVEFARELSDRVAFLVAADGAVKRTGWDYRLILGALSRSSPAFSPADLAQTIVDHVDTLDGDVSLARLDLAQAEALEGAFTTLVERLKAVTADPDETAVLFIMLKRTSYLQVRQFLDLRDLCHQLRTGFGGDIATAAEDVLAAYKTMVSSRAIGAAAGRLNGLSVYCPLFRAREPFGTDVPDVDAIVEEAGYAALKFVATTKWLELCDGLRARLAFVGR